MGRWGGGESGVGSQESGMGVVCGDYIYVCMYVCMYVCVYVCMDALCTRVFLCVGWMASIGRKGRVGLYRRTRNRIGLIHFISIIRERIAKAPRPHS